jgi:hypothetical protein
MFLVPGALGERLLGSLWEPATALLLPTTLAFVGISFMNGAAAGLRALAAARRSLLATLVCASTSLAGGAGGPVSGRCPGISLGRLSGDHDGRCRVVVAVPRRSPRLPSIATAGRRDRKRTNRPDRISSRQDSTRHGSETLVTDTPRLSVGLPVYNGQRYLAEALDALLGESLTDFELIISDNASTDETEETCRRYPVRDPRIRYIRQPFNIDAASNHKFQQARGELFKLAAHDDLYASKFSLAELRHLTSDQN